MSYNETLLRKLHGTPQIRTLTNVSIPLLDTAEDLSEEDTNCLNFSTDFNE